MARTSTSVKPKTSLPDAAAAIVIPMLQLIETYHSSTGDLKQYLKENIGLLFRHMEKFAPIHMSKAAYKLALDICPQKPDLRSYNFRGICKIRENRQTPPFFFWEHAYPVGNFLKEALAKRNLSREELIHLLCKSEIAVILRTENGRLNKKYKTDRADWRVCYAACEIEPIYANDSLQ